MRLFNPGRAPGPAGFPPAGFSIRMEDDGFFTLLRTPDPLLDLLGHLLRGKDVGFAALLAAPQHQGVFRQVRRHPAAQADHRARLLPGGRVGFLGRGLHQLRQGLGQLFLGAQGAALIALGAVPGQPEAPALQSLAQGGRRLHQGVRQRGRGLLPQHQHRQPVVHRPGRVPDHQPPGFAGELPVDLAQAVAGGVVPDLEGLRPVRSPAAGVIDAALPPGAQGLKILHIQRKGIRHDAQLAPGPAGGRNRQQGEGVPHRDPGDPQGQAAAQTAGHGALPLRQGHAGGFAGDGVLRRQVKPHPSHRQGPGTAQGQADGGGPSLFRSAGALLAVVLALTLSSLNRSGKSSTIVLAGIAVHSLAQTVLMCLKLTADPERELASIEYWMMGSLNGVSIHSISGNLILCVLCMGVLFLLHRQIILLSAEEGEARMLGVRVVQLRLLVLMVATLSVSSVVSLTGLISFVGLLAPHGARLLTGQNRMGTMLLGGLLGGILLCGADILARSVASTELPVSIFTSVLGAPFLIFLIVQGRQRE